MIEMWRARLRELSVRQLALIGALLLLAASGAAFLWEDEPETVVTLRQEPVLPPTTEIEGLAAAAQKMPLRNPFTDEHETFGEILHAKANGEAAPPQAVQSAPPPPAAEARPPASLPEPPALRGVVVGAGGTRLAILAAGTDGAVLGIGETWKGYTLRSLTDSAATLDTASGIITLTRE